MTQDCKIVEHGMPGGPTASPYVLVTVSPPTGSCARINYLVSSVNGLENCDISRLKATRAVRVVDFVFVDSFKANVGNQYLQQALSSFPGRDYGRGL